ncbi:uncharacterized protein LAESUDRAFT_757252 [Laetiporus sulphureus 93-53]|uniref:Uncharacterized protein n=1 Tax=Laetiporus sulphureus 93-53 TaxID=1314785 RepID=A0A165F7A5_9APHY|nr:uncharacterized protein LAESUDRAFT_757252 [Laetiporus sulphureus 93-53]KZT08525.1 hypothetical protein LAESUDRAFT_757252 [Laetiporus sulphureus 93-53]
MEIVRMEMVRLGFKYAVPVSAGVVLALVGYLISVMAALGQIFPRVARTPSKTRDILLVEEMRLVRQSQRRHSTISRQQEVYIRRSLSISAGTAPHTAPSLAAASNRVRFTDSPIIRSFGEAIAAIKVEASATRPLCHARSFEYSSLAENAAEVHDNWLAEGDKRARVFHKSHTHSPEDTIVRGRRPSFVHVRSVLEETTTNERHYAVASGKPKIVKMASVPSSSLKHMRELLIRPRNMSLKRHSPPVPRTDPYKAPYNFPSPASPAAANYICEVKTSRGHAATSVHKIAMLKDEAREETSVHVIDSTRLCNLEQPRVSQEQRIGTKPRSSRRQTNEHSRDHSLGKTMRRWSLHFPLAHAHTPRSPPLDSTPMKKPKMTWVYLYGI